MEIKRKKRNEIDNAYKWRINDMIESDEKWEAEFAKITEMLNSFERFKTTLCDSAESLLCCLKEQDTIAESTIVLYVYSHMKFDEDTNITCYQSMSDRSESLHSKLAAALAFINPAIIKAGKEKIAKFIDELPDLKLYEHYLNDILRKGEHILSDELEELLAKTADLSAAPKSIYRLLNNADMRFGSMEDEEGNTVELTHGKFRTFLESANRDVRRTAFENVYSSYIKQKNTLAAIYNANVKNDVFYTKARRFASSLEHSLDEYNIPVDVYKKLIETVNEYLPELHRYVRIRKQRLGLDEMHMYDMYTPIVSEMDVKVTIEEAKAKILEGLAPLGDAYCGILKQGFDGGWIDVYENEGKRSGAYSWGVYSCHPYVLLNYENKLDDMFTLAHEMGHALHSYYSWSTQPFIYSDYTIFLAEVASTVNEAMLIEHLMKHTDDKNMMDYLINNYLEQFKGTLFRQTMFAEFELAAHEMVERGEPLTVDSLCALYLGLNKKYYGDAVISDEQISYEWSRIPHFYTPFYVYQYATGYSAAIALSKRILEQGKPAVDPYIDFLKSGGKDYSTEILKRAGVDMTSPQPIREALGVFSSLLDRLEEK